MTCRTSAGSLVLARQGFRVHSRQPDSGETSWHTERTPAQNLLLIACPGASHHRRSLRQCRQSCKKSFRGNAILSKNVDDEIRTRAGDPIHLAGVRLNHSATSTDPGSSRQFDFVIPTVLSYNTRRYIISCVLNVKLFQHAAASSHHSTCTSNKDLQDKANKHKVQASV